MTAMGTDQLGNAALFWLLVIPAVVVWLLVVVDIVTRPGVRGVWRAGWLVAVTLMLPLALLWLLVRPTGDPIRVALDQLDQADPRVQLVDLVARHDDGGVDDATFVQDRDELLGYPTSN